MNTKTKKLAVQESIQEIFSSKSRLKSECDEFIRQSMAIARIIDEKLKPELPCERQVRNCISESMQPLQEAKTSVGDIGKYEIIDPPLYYNLNLYMTISYAILWIYKDIQEKELKDEIKGLLLDCLENFKEKVHDMLAAVSDEKLIYDEELQEHFTVYLENLEIIIIKIMEESSTNIDILIYIERLRERRTYIYERTVALTDTPYFNNIQNKINGLYDDWQKFRKEEDAKQFLDDTLSIFNGISQLGGIILSGLGLEENAKAWEGTAVIIGATLAVGASIIMAAITGPMGIVGIGASLIGGINSIVSFFIGLGQQSPEEIILEQIQKLGSMIQENFTALFEYLDRLKLTIIEKFMDIRLDIKNLEEKISTIQTTLDSIFNILLDEEYFNLRNEVLTYHNNFDIEMSESLQISGFYNFVNCAMIKAKDKSKHMNQGIEYCLEGIEQNGIDEYITFLAEYADQYICTLNKEAKYISPMYWGEGCLSLIEFILRTPEFVILDKQKKTFTQMISLGESVNALARECFQKEVVKKIIIKYQNCLQNLSYNFRYIKPKSLKDQDISEFINNLFKLYEEVSKDQVLKSLEEYKILIKAYFYLTLRWETLNNAHLGKLLDALWGEKDFLNYFNRECGELNKYKYTIKSEYDNLLEAEGTDAAEAITIFINDKYGPFKRIYNIIVELNRVCRVLMNYSEKQGINTDYPLINTVRDYMNSFTIEFFSDDTDTRMITSPFGLEHFNYFCLDFGNTLHFNSLTHFDSKDVIVIGDISLPDSTDIVPWKVLDGNWHIEVEEGSIKQIEFLFNIDDDKIYFPLYLHFASRFLDMDDDTYFDRQVKLTLKNSSGDYVIAENYRPEWYNGTFSYLNQLTLFDGVFLRSQLKAPVFPESLWIIPADKISVGENRLVLSTNSSLMVQKIEIGSQLKSTESDPEIYFHEKKLNKYLGLEAINLNGNTIHKIILKDDLDETCYFKLKKMEFMDRCQLYSMYINDIIVPTPFKDRFLWVNSFDLRPRQELLDSCNGNWKALVERNVWLKLVESKEVYTFVLTIFEQEYRPGHDGYLCSQEDIDKSNKQFFAGNITLKTPLWFQILNKS